MFGFHQRKMVALGLQGSTPPPPPPPPPVAGYNVFGRYYIKRISAGQYTWGNLDAADQQAMDFQSTGNGFNGGSRALCKTRFNGVEAGVFNVVQLDNPLVSPSPNITYNRDELVTHDAFHAGSVFNGSRFRAAYDMPSATSTFITNAVQVGREADTFLFNGTLDLPFNFRWYIARRLVLRQFRDINANTIFSTQTGYADYLVLNVFESPFNRIIATTDRVQNGNTSNSWNWNVEQYTGSLNDGLYRILSGQIVSATSTNATIAIKTLRPQNTRSNTGFSSSTIYAANGFITLRAMSLETAPVYLNQDIPIGAADYELLNGNPRFDSAATGLDPILSLYGGDIRINTSGQVSMFNGPFVNRFADTNDRWIRDGGSMVEGYPAGTPLA